MNRTFLTVLTLLGTLLLITACEQPKPRQDAAKAYYILCEGNFGSSNASLWGLNADLDSLSGPLHWDPNTNPLGDVGQSLYRHQDRLYIVLNNSHVIEVMTLSDDEPEPLFTIQLPGASPRYMAFHDDVGFISCWNLNAVLRMDLTRGEVVDTFDVGGLPEDIIWYEDRLWVGVTMDDLWQTENKVISWPSRLPWTRVRYR